MIDAERSRVVHKHGTFAIHRVYPDELDEALEMYQAALDLPVLEYSDLIPEDEPLSVEMAF